MADRLYLNPNYFSEVFKQYAGIGFNEFLTNLRIERAKELLSYQQFSIKEIADLVGYSDANYFAKVFKKLTGQSPVQYRTKSEFE